MLTAEPADMRKMKQEFLSLKSVHVDLEIIFD